MERREIGIGDGELCSSLFGVVVAASLELGVEMKARLSPQPSPSSLSAELSAKSR